MSHRSRHTKTTTIYTTTQPSHHAYVAPSHGHHGHHRGHTVHESRDPGYHSSHRRYAAPYQEGYYYDSKPHRSHSVRISHCILAGFLLFACYPRVISTKQQTVNCIYFREAATGLSAYSAAAVNTHIIPPIIPRRDTVANRTMVTLVAPEHILFRRWRNHSSPRPSSLLLHIQNRIKTWPIICLLVT